MNKRKTLGITMLLAGALAFVLFVANYIESINSFGFQLSTYSGNLVGPPFSFYLVTGISVATIIMGIMVLVSNHE